MRDKIEGIKYNQFRRNPLLLCKGIGHSILASVIAESREKERRFYYEI
jgi:hypothetical protein